MAVVLELAWGAYNSLRLVRFLSGRREVTFFFLFFLFVHTVIILRTSTVQYSYHKIIKHDRPTNTAALTRFPSGDYRQDTFYRTVLFLLQYDIIVTSRSHEIMRHKTNNSTVHSFPFPFSPGESVDFLGIARSCYIVRARHVLEYAAAVLACCQRERQRG